MPELRTFKSYQEMKDTHQKEFNAVPLMFVFAFAEKEFISKMSEQIKAKKPDAVIESVEDIGKYVYSIGAGGYILKEDAHILDEVSKRSREEEKAFRKSEKNFIEEIVYEMGNHEYSYTNDPEDTLEALGKTLDDLKDAEFQRIWNKAKKKYMKRYGHDEDDE